MEHLQTQLSESEEAVLELMKRVTKLETENENLREENKRLKWSLQEHD
jgi:regulator of replication initiation timing